VNLREWISQELVFGQFFERIEKRNTVLHAFGKTVLRPDGSIQGPPRIHGWTWSAVGDVLIWNSITGQVVAGFNGNVFIGESPLLLGSPPGSTDKYFLFPYVSIRHASAKVLYVISSHVAYGKPREVLLSQMLAIGVPPGNIWVTVAGSNNAGIRVVDGITFSHVAENGYEYTGLLDIVKHDVECDLVFLLHDTCHVGPQFHSLVQEQPYSLRIDYMPVLGEGLFNIGLYRKDFLVGIFGFLESLMGISKQRAIDIELDRTSEGFRHWAKVSSNFLCEFGHKKGIRFPYDPKVGRNTMYLVGADMYKFYSLGNENKTA